MIFDIICAVVVATVAGTVGYDAASTVLAYASDGLTPRVLDKFVTVCSSFALVFVLAAANIATGDLNAIDNDTVTFVADALGIVAMFAVLVFDLCTAHLLSAYKRQRYVSMFDPDTPKIEPTTKLRAALYVSCLLYTSPSPRDS